MNIPAESATCKIDPISNIFGVSNRIGKELLHTCAPLIDFAFFFVISTLPLCNEHSTSAPSISTSAEYKDADSISLIILWMIKIN